MKRNKIAVILACAMVLLQGVIFGLGDPISKIAYEEVEVYSLLAARFGIALIVLFGLFPRRIIKNLKESSIKEWIIPCLCTALCYICGNIALDYTAATSVAFLRSLSTVMTPILVLVLFRATYKWIHIPVQTAVVVGLYLLCIQGGFGGFGRGEVFALLAALFMAGSLVFGEKSLKHVDAVTLTAMQCLMAVILNLILAFVMDGGIHLAHVSGISWCIILYLAIPCTVIGYFLQNAALVYISPQKVAMLQCFCPVMTAFFSFVILGEQLTAAGMTGAGMILICVIAETGIQDRI